MAKHKLYRQFDSTSPLISSQEMEISPLRVVHPSSSDLVPCKRFKMGKSKCADKCVANRESPNNEEVTKERTDFTISEPLPGGDCVPDSDSDDDYNKYVTKGLKLPYSAKEDEWILKFVLKGQNIYKVGSLSLWKHLESKKENPKRTYQSLKNRFLRCIKPHLFKRYAHLIKTDTEIEKILAKFPELRCKVGRTNTLSRIQLPARNQNSKPAEGGLLNGSPNNYKIVTPPRMSTSACPPNASAQGGPILNLHHFSNSERKVTYNDESVEVSVNFSSKEPVQNPVTPPIGIYETYKKFKKKNKLVLCSACGRYNQPKTKKSADSSAADSPEGDSLDVSAGKRALVGSPLDSGQSSVTNSQSPPAKLRKLARSRSRSFSPFSPSVLKDADEEVGMPIGWGTPDEPPGINEVGRAPVMSNSVALRQEADSAFPNRLSEMVDDFDSAYDETVTDFKKLIKNEEERLLVRRCLYGKAGILGLSNSLSQVSMESYFVELSPNLQTPELTIDYSSRLTGESSERDSSNSLLARNMMRMLESTTFRES